jgi:hypothetical protein
MYVFFFIPTCLWRWNRQSVPKRRHTKFRRRGITQKKTYNKRSVSVRQAALSFRAARCEHLFFRVADWIVPIFPNQLTGFLYVCNSSFYSGMRMSSSGVKHATGQFIRSVRIVAKSAYYIHHAWLCYACISAASTGGIFVKCIGGLFMKISWGKIQICLKPGKKISLYMKT